MPNALMLLSGGLDSVTSLAWALEQGLTIISTLSFDYGQRHLHAHPHRLQRRD